MIPLKLRRKHLRAPLHTFFIFKDEAVVRKGMAENISEGGLLLRVSDLKDVKSSFSVFFDLPVTFNGVLVSPFINSTKCFFPSLSTCSSNF